MEHPEIVLRLNRAEYELLVRLIGHHTSGNGLGRLYKQLRAHDQGFVDEMKTLEAVDGYRHPLVIA